METVTGASSSAERSAHRSTASIGGHPLHPMVVPMPIGMLTTAALSDIAFVVTRDRFFARASRWLLGGGVVSGAMAGVLGLADYATIRAARGPIGTSHAAGNATVLAMSLLSLALRRDRRETPIWAAALTLASAAVLAMTGWLGGELTFRHRIGVVPAATNRRGSSG